MVGFGALGELALGEIPSDAPSSVTATGSIPEIALSAPSGTATGGSSATATGSIDEVSLSAPGATATTSSTATGSIDAVSLTAPNGTASTGTLTLSPAEIDAIADAIWSNVIETFKADEMLRIMFAALAGKRDGIGTTTETYYAQDGIKPRVVFTPDASGNGTPTLDGTP